MLFAKECIKANRRNATTLNAHSKHTGKVIGPAIRLSLFVLVACSSQVMQGKRSQCFADASQPEGRRFDGSSVERKSEAATSCLDVADKGDANLLRK